MHTIKGRFKFAFREFERRAPRRPGQDSAVALHRVGDARQAGTDIANGFS
ncbi:MAG: hypothetical protein RL339_685 [Pseudomonadota bacterium]|jgi:hypothetical protein